MTSRLQLPQVMSALMLALSLASSFAVASPLELLGTRIAPGTSVRLQLALTESFGGGTIMSPVQAVLGAETGPRLCLTGAIHGDELNGIEVVRRILDELDPLVLRGSVIGMPIVNVPAVANRSRYLSDRRDLNRFFPGKTKGSLAARIAHAVFDKVLRHCELLIDVHTGSAQRSNLPQVRADMDRAGVARLASSLGGLPIVEKNSGEGTLRRAALEAGITAVTLEAGEAGRIDRGAVGVAVDAIHSAMRAYGMLAGAPSAPGPVFASSHWVRATEGGLFFAAIALGDTVTQGQLLGEVIDPVTSVRIAVLADRAGRVIGLAHEQMVMPGNALANVAVAAKSRSAR